MKKTFIVIKQAISKSIVTRFALMLAFVLALGAHAHATASEAATAGATAITGFVTDVNTLGAAFILVIAAIVAWVLVSKFLHKSK